MVARDGGVFTFGDATFYGSLGGVVLQQPVVGMATTPSSAGYWLVARDGGIFTFGDATFHGSLGGTRLERPIVGIAATGGSGYWLVGRDGGVFTFGDASFHGAGGGAGANSLVVGMAPTPSGKGYWLVSAIGGVLGNSGRPVAPEHADADAPPPAPPVSPVSPPAPAQSRNPTPRPAQPAGGPALGVYVAPVSVGGIQGLERFGADVGATVTHASAYIDHNADMEMFANSAWLLDPWANWLRQDSNRRLILGVPILQNHQAGDFYNTSYDRYFVRLAESLRDRGMASQVVIRLGFEMNGDWGPYGRHHNPDGAGFRDKWRRVVPQMKAVYPLVFDWSIVPSFRPGSPSHGAIFYPGDDVVDVIGIDLYDAWVSGSPDERWHYHRSLLDDTANFAAARGKPMALDEWGLWASHSGMGGGDNPAFITNMLNWARDHRLLWTSYFNSSAGGVNTTLQNNPNGLNAFRRFLAGG